MPNKNSMLDSMFAVIFILMILSCFLSVFIYSTIDNAKTYTTEITMNQLILRPNGDSGTNQWVTNGTGTGHYSFVNESISDNDTTFLKRNTGSHYASEFFNMTNHVDENGTIVNVTVYSVAKKSNDTSIVFSFRIADNRNLVYVKVVSSQQLTTSWASYSYSFSDNWNDTTWTWGNIDNMSCGIFGEKIDLNYSMVTQTYAIVNYETSSIITNPAPPIFMLLPIMFIIIIMGVIVYLRKNFWSKK